jgi:cytidylate kinase
MQNHLSLDNIVEEQIRKWQIEQRKKYKNPIRPVITLSRLPGTMGGHLARKLAEDLNIDLFDQKFIDNIIENAQIGQRIIESLDEQDRSVYEEWISSLGEDHMWSYEYLKRLTSVIAAIGTHGYAVIIGKGACFILPKEVNLRILVTAPLENRIRNVMETYNVPEHEARRQILRTESERHAFIRQYFHTEWADPVNYDLVVNMENIDIDLAASVIKELFTSRHWYNYSFR